MECNGLHNMLTQHMWGKPAKCHQALLHSTRGPGYEASPSPPPLLPALGGNSDECWRVIACTTTSVDTYCTASSDSKCHLAWLETWFIDLFMYCVPLWQ